MLSYRWMPSPVLHYTVKVLQYHYSFIIVSAKHNISRHKTGLIFFGSFACYCNGIELYVYQPLCFLPQFPKMLQTDLSLRCLALTWVIWPLEKSNTSSLSSLRIAMLFWQRLSLVRLAPTISLMKVGQCLGHSCFRICRKFVVLHDLSIEQTT